MSKKEIQDKIVKNTYHVLYLKVIPNLEDNIHEVPLETELQPSNEFCKEYQSNDSAENFTDITLFSDVNIVQNSRNISQGQSSDGNQIKKVIINLFKTVVH